MDIAQMTEGTIRLALAEDLGAEGDITSKAVCPPDASGVAGLIAREPCRVAGQPVVAKVFELAGGGATYEVAIEDGEEAGPGEVLGRVRGPLLAILAGERTALNFLCHMCGIATLTARLVAVARPFGVAIMDTRKTSPGQRSLEKYAVEMGGGTNHRKGLFDGVIIKDNHIAAAGGVEVALRRVRGALGDRFPIEVETATLAQVRQAVDCGADVVMLDNMDPGMVEKAVALVAGRAKVEVSGGVSPSNIESFVRLGMDAISLGFVTHSAPAADISLVLEEG